GSHSAKGTPRLRLRPTSAQSPPALCGNKADRRARRARRELSSKGTPRLRLRPTSAQSPPGELAAKGGFARGSGRWTLRRGQGGGEALAVAPALQVDLLAGFQRRNQQARLLGVANLLAVDRQDDVAWLQARDRGGAAVDDAGQEQ